MSTLGKDMTFGVLMLNTIPPWKTDAEELRDEFEQIKLADELGFHSAWVAEHNSNKYGAVASAQVYLAAAAVQTKRIKIGSAVVRLPLHQPVKLAEDLSLVDVLSNGRLYVGVGKGYDPNEYAGYNVDFELKDEMYREALDIMEAAFKNDKISHSGKFYNLKNVTTYPRPIQKSGPPIFVMVSKSDSTMIEAAKRGYSFILNHYNQIDYDHAKRKIALYQETALAAGFSQAYIDEVIQRSGKTAFVYVAETMEQAIDEFRGGYEYYNSLRHDRAVAGYSSEKIEYTNESFINDKGIIIGTPEQVTKDIKELRDKTGLNHLVCWFNCGGQPQNQVMRSMNLFAKEVMPHFNNSLSLSN